MSNNAVSSVLEKFTALNNEYQEIAEQAKVDLKEYNDYCDSSDNDLSKKMAELREKFARVEAHLEYARAHASDLEEAEMPFKTEWEQLDELHSKINPESTSDVYAETLYTKASGQKLYYESEVERTKKKILGSKVQAKRLYDSQLAELEERKKKVYDEFKEYANSEEFKAYIKGLSKDAAAFNSSGKSNLPVGTEISLGQRRVRLPVPPELDEELSLATSGVFNSAAKTIGAPYSLDLSAGKTVFVEFDNRNESYMLGGIQRLILNVLKYYEPTIDGVFLADSVHYSDDSLGHIAGLSKVNNPIIEPVPADADAMLAKLREIKSSLAEAGDEPAVKRVFVFHGFPEGFSSEARSEIIELTENCKKYRATVVLTHDCTNELEDKSMLAALRAVQTDAEIIRSRNGGFYVESTHDSLFWYSAPSDLPDEVRRAFIEHRRVAVSAPAASAAPAAEAPAAETVYASTAPAAPETQSAPAQAPAEPAPVSAPAQANDELRIEYKKAVRKLSPVKLGDVEFDLESVSSVFVCGKKSAGRGAAVLNIIDSIIMTSHPDDVELWLADFSGTTLSVYEKAVPAHIRYLVLGGNDELAYSIIDRLCEVIEKREKLFRGRWDSYKDVPTDIYMPELVCVIEGYAAVSAAAFARDGYFAKLRSIFTKAESFGIKLVLSDEAITDGYSGSAFGVAYDEELPWGSLKVDAVSENYSRETIESAAAFTHRGLYEDESYKPNLVKSYISKQTLVKRVAGSSSFADNLSEIKKNIVPLAEELMIFMGSRMSLTPDEPIVLKPLFGENVLVETPERDAVTAVNAITSAISSAKLQEREVVLISSVGNPAAKIIASMEQYKDIPIITDILEIEQHINTLNSDIIHRNSAKKLVVVMGADVVLAELATIDLGGRTNYVGNFIYNLSQAVRIGYHFMLQLSDRELTPEYKTMSAALRHKVSVNGATGVCEYSDNTGKTAFMLYSNYQPLLSEHASESEYLL